MTKTIPHVDYLELGDKPHLVANECTSCGARFFDRRNACAKCFKNDFKKVAISTDGILKSFTIVAFAAPGVPVPFVAGIIDCGGTSVRGNVVNSANAASTQLTSNARDLYSAAAANGEQSAKVVYRQIEDHPVAAALIVLGAAYLGGRLITRS